MAVKSIHDEYHTIRLPPPCYLPHPPLQYPAIHTVQTDKYPLILFPHLRSRRRREEIRPGQSRPREAAWHEREDHRQGARDVREGDWVRLRNSPQLYFH